jgi:MATE family multidrug resistance protein
MTAVITRARSLRQEFRPMFSLAVPVVFAELGWMAMGIVDTLMVGRIGPEAIGAVGVGTSLFMGVVIVAMGVLLGLDTLVSHAFGAGRLLDCHRWLLHGCVLVGVVSLPLTWMLWLVAGWLDAWGLDPRVLEPTRSYLGAVTWSVVPLLLYTAFRRYLQGMGVVRPIMMALLTANVANVILNWMLIFGNLGAPALGVTGAAWATVGSRVVMAGFLLLVIAHRERGLQPGLLQTPLRVDLSWMRRLLVLGSPAALQITLEVGVFAAATALAGRLVPAALAAHQIALNVAAFAFMVPFGVSSAGAVRVGHAVGRVDPHAASRAGWTALLFGVGFMTLAALTFVTIPSLLISAFTTDPRVLDIGVSLLLVAAVFQMFDGLQVVATGVLRGLGDTRTPMLWNLAGHWLIGLPLGYTLCFNVGFGVVGLWWGLSTGLIICGIALLAVWRQRIHALVAKDTTVDSRKSIVGSRSR